MKLEVKKIYTLERFVLIRLSNDYTLPITPNRDCQSLNALSLFILISKHQKLCISLVFRHICGHGLGASHSSGSSHHLSPQLAFPFVEPGPYDRYQVTT